MKFKIINDLSIFLYNIIPEKHLSKLQEFLMRGAIFTEASEVLAMLIIFILLSEIALALLLTIFGLPTSVLVLPFFSIPILFTYIVVVQERRAQEIEKSAPDFLRQLSSMLQVGLSFENAIEDMAQYADGPLYAERSNYYSSHDKFINNYANNGASVYSLLGIIDINNSTFISNKAV